MPAMLDTVHTYFQTRNWPFIQSEALPIVQVEFTGAEQRWAVQIFCIEEQGQCVVYSLCPVRAPALRRPDVMDLLTRANCNLILGNFELDLASGDIRFKTSLAVGDADLTSDLFERLLLANVATMDRYLPGVMQVIYGAESPEAVLMQIEQPGN
jgi:hypothetical protein